MGSSGEVGAVQRTFHLMVQKSVEGDTDRVWSCRRNFVLASRLLILNGLLFCTYTNNT